MHLRPACKSGRKCPSKPGQPLLLLPRPGLPLVPVNQVCSCHQLNDAAVRHRGKDVRDGISWLLLSSCKLVWQSASFDSVTAAATAHSLSLRGCKGDPCWTASWVAVVFFEVFGCAAK